MSILDDARPGMDLGIRPQDDLFGHVNGRWLDEEDIPSDRSSWGPFVQLADQAEQHVHAIIEELAAAGGDADDTSGDSTKIADLYHSFVDEETVEAKGAKPIRPLLQAAADLRDVRDLAAFLGDFEKRGGGGLFASYVDNDDRDAERNIVYFRQGGLGLPDETYYKDEKFAEKREKYLEHLERMFGLVGHADPVGSAETVLRLETRLAEGHWERAATRDVIKTYNLKTLAELKQLCPAFDWDGWIRNLGGTPDTLFEVCVRQPSYLEHLSGVLAETPIEDWRTWMAARVVRAAAPYLSSDLVEENFDFYGRTLGGTPELRARWKRGVALVEGAMGEAVGREYAERHFPPESKAMMDELVANLIEAYRRSIAALDWMGEETKQLASAKLETFMPKIGYPVKWRDYSTLKFYRDDLLGNVAASSSFETARQLAKVGAPVDKDEWLMLPQTVNAYYNPGTNEICFPAGILQRPFFAPDGDLAENYGGIGAVIGHEVGHGFDDQGSQYDGLGNLNDWWTADDKAAFQEKSQALIAQYDGFEPRAQPGEHVNGALTVGENIGDLGGLTIAHQAYAIAKEALGEQVTPEDSRRLFMNWAYCWRTKRRKETELQYLTIDPHSPPEFRANIVRNLDEFHTAFGTVSSDELWIDPEERVRIW